MELPGYDAWKTTPPEDDEYATICADCDRGFPEGEHVEDESCPRCNGTLCRVMDYDPRDEPDYWD